MQCCDPIVGQGGGWGIFNALFGWNNSATYGSVISYNVFWIVTTISFLAMRYKEKRGHLPFLRHTDSASSDEGSSGKTEYTNEAKLETKEKVQVGKASNHSLSP